MTLNLQSPPRPRSPWQRFYGLAHGLRARWYRSRCRRLPRPVVSIGNLHWGGTGKTPLTAAVAARLRDRGFAVTILSRGYGGKGKGVRVVSTGQGPLLGPTVAGDEPVLLAGELPGVGVVVAADRYEAGRHALERLEPVPQIFVLDDGFSHLALHRDLDVLAFPAADPFGGGKLMPGGRLREPLTSAARAHAAVLTGAGKGAGEDLHDGPGVLLAETLRPFGFQGPGFASETRTGIARRVQGEVLAPGTRVLLVSAIARPENFRRAAEGAGFEVAEELTFADHHAYPETSLERIGRAFEACGAEAVLATAKDRVKLHGRLDLPLVELPVEAVPEPAFWVWLDESVDGLVGDQAEARAEGRTRGRPAP